LGARDIIDTHLHLIYRDRLNYPWLANAERLDDDFPYERYLREARRCGITDALHMEVDVAEADMEAETANVGALAAEPDTLIRGAIASCRPERAEFPAYLERALANPLVRGFRRILHEAPDEVSVSLEFRENVRRLSGTGKPFDVCVRPDQLDKAISLVDAAPDVQFVLDHCGAPRIAEREFHPWRERVAELARRPNAAAKISGIVAYADGATWNAQDLRPYVEHVIDAFGWDRVVWGSDWPVCTLNASLSLWVAATHAITRGASAEERDKLFAGNARRIWRLPA
jgi:predicted TIM-barrel fold metal-dependent hydrolase